MQPTIPVPISTDQHGAFRVANTRITLDVIVAAHQQGDTPEQIHEGFPSLKLADIYAVITYYLNNQSEVEAYLRRRDEESAQTHREIEASNPEMFRLQRELNEFYEKDPDVQAWQSIDDFYEYPDDDEQEGKEAE